MYYAKEPVFEGTVYSCVSRVLRPFLGLVVTETLKGLQNTFQ